VRQPCMVNVGLKGVNGVANENQILPSLFDPSNVWTLRVFVNLRSPFYSPHSEPDRRARESLSTVARGSGARSNRKMPVQTRRCCINETQFTRRYIFFDPCRLLRIDCIVIFSYPHRFVAMLFYKRAMGVRSGRSFSEVAESVIVLCL
jgi:hypothetical protein